MTDADILTIVKSDLLISSTAQDAFIQHLINSAKEAIGIEGITLNLDSPHDADIVRMYACYLYRKRREDGPMPRALRWALNNRLFHEKSAE